ncbi:MAG: hypothetical protein ABIJ65_10705 [Chloroflexota bacterium]
MITPQIYILLSIVVLLLVALLVFFVNKKKPAMKKTSLHWLAWRLPSSWQGYF